MSELDVKKTTKTPLHLWIVALVGLWNSMAGLDYVMLALENTAYLSVSTAQHADGLVHYPTWVFAAWGIAVGGGFAGSVLLLMRRRLATIVFLVSWIAMGITLSYNTILSHGMKVFGPRGHLIHNGVIFLLALGLVFYALSMKRRGVLR